METADDSPADALASLEVALGHRFRDSVLLRRALTHASFANESEDVEDNEKLEFLGDSVLNFLVAEKLFAAFPARGRRHAVEGAVAARLGRALRRARAARRARSRLCASRPARSARAAATATRASRTRSRPCSRRCSSTAASRRRARRRDASSTPTWPRSTSESCTGAIRRRRSRSGRRPRASRCRSICLVEESGPPHDRRFVYEVTYGEGISARGEGNSKKDAQRAAADALLKRLEKGE